MNALCERHYSSFYPAMSLMPCPTLNSDYRLLATASFSFTRCPRRAEGVTPLKMKRFGTGFKRFIKQKASDIIREQGKTIKYHYMLYYTLFFTFCIEWKSLSTQDEPNLRMSSRLCKPFFASRPLGWWLFMGHSCKSGGKLGIHIITFIEIHSSTRQQGFLPSLTYTCWLKQGDSP